jgi:hypothetical protein
MKIHPGAVALLAACTGTNVASVSEEVEVTSGTVQALTAVGAARTGISYALVPAPSADLPPTLVLENDAFEGLVRDFIFTDVAGAAEVHIASLPPGPVLPPGPTLPPGPMLPPGPYLPPGPMVPSTLLAEVVLPPGPSLPPGPTRLAAFGVSPPIVESEPGVLGFEIDGSNYRIVGAGSLTDAQIRFNVIDADGNVVAQFPRSADLSPP